MAKHVDLGRRIEVLAVAFGHTDSKEANVWETEAKGIFDALVAEYGAELAHGFNAARKRARMPVLPKEEAHREYVGPMFEWLVTKNRFQRYVFLYWDDEGRTEAAFRTCWYRAAEWSAWAAIRSVDLRGAICPGFEEAEPGASEDDWAEDSSGLEAVSCAPPRAQELFQIFSRFVDDLFKGERNERRDATLLVLYYYVFLAPLPAAKDMIDKAAKYCMEETGSSGDSLRQELDKARMAKITAAPVRRKVRRLHDDPPLDFRDIGRWMGEQPSSNGYHGNLQSRKHRLQRRLKKVLDGAIALEADT